MGSFILKTLSEKQILTKLYISFISSFKAKKYCDFLKLGGLQSKLTMEMKISIKGTIPGLIDVVRADSLSYHGRQM